MNNAYSMNCFSSLTKHVCLLNLPFPSNCTLVCSVTIPMLCVVSSRLKRISFISFHTYHSFIQSETVFPNNFATRSLFCLVGFADAISISKIHCQKVSFWNFLETRTPSRNSYEKFLQIESMTTLLDWTFISIRVRTVGNYILELNVRKWNFTFSFQVSVLNQPVNVVLILRYHFTCYSLDIYLL